MYDMALMRSSIGKIPDERAKERSLGVESVSVYAGPGLVELY